MWGVIETALSSPAGSFAFVAGLLVLSYWLVHYVTKKIERWSIKAEHVDKLDAIIDTIKEDIHFIKATLNVMQSNNGGLTQSHSPISLTDKGKEVAKEMDIDNIISRNWDNIYDLIEKQRLRNAYDIQQFCIEMATINIDKLFTRDDVDKIKDFAYKKGQQVAYYGSMIGVIIRDKYFEAKGIPVSDVDTNDPNKNK